MFGVTTNRNGPKEAFLDRCLSHLENCWLCTLIRAIFSNQSFGPQVTYSYYQTIGIPNSATDEQVKEAYRKCARQWHPDRNPPDEAEVCAQKMAEINEAYGTLSDPARRRVYDQFGDLLKDKHPFSGSTHGGSPAELFESAVCIMNCVRVPPAVISELEDNVSKICALAKSRFMLPENLVNSLQSFGLQFIVDAISGMVSSDGRCCECRQPIVQLCDLCLCREGTTKMKAHHRTTACCRTTKEGTRLNIDKNSPIKKNRKI